MARPRTSPNVQYYWAEPDPDIVSQQVLELSYGLDDFEEPLLAAGAIVQQNIGVRFKTGTDPSGRAWDDWSEEYRDWRKREGKGRTFPDRASLHLTGELEREVTSPSNYRIANDALFLDTSGLPDHWAWNNFGAVRKTAAAREFEAEEEQEALFGVNVLPERPFVGVSLLARNKISAAFEAWFANEVQIATSPKGTPFFRHAKRGPGGRFAKR